MRELQYVLRAYDKDGNFDETNPQPLWLVLDDGTRTDVPPQDTQRSRRRSCSRATARAG